MPKDTQDPTHRSSQDAAIALISMTGSAKAAERASRRFTRGVTSVTIGAYASREKKGLNETINATFCALFAEEYAADHGVPEESARDLCALWLRMKDAAMPNSTVDWYDIIGEVERLTADKSDLFSSLLRFTAHWHLPRQAGVLPNDPALDYAERALHIAIVHSDFGLFDEDFEGILSLENEAYFDDAVDIEKRHNPVVQLDWTRDPRFAPTGILLSAALIAFLQLATFRGSETLAQMLRHTDVQGRLPLLFAAGRLFKDKSALIAATEAIADTMEYVPGARSHLETQFAHADALFTNVAGMCMEELPGFEQNAGAALKKAITDLRTKGEDQ